MAELPDPTAELTGEDRAAFERIAAVRSTAEGRADPLEVYVRMFNNPALATKVSALGEHMRFGGVLPDEVRELAIIRFAARRGYWYEWAHHQHPARVAGVDDAVIAAVTGGEIPSELPDATRAALEAVDLVVADRSLPSGLQQRIVDAFGTAGAVELVILCGLYALMGAMITAFDIPIEDGLPQPPR